MSIFENSKWFRMGASGAAVVAIAATLALTSGASIPKSLADSIQPATPPAWLRDGQTQGEIRPYHVQPALPLELPRPDPRPMAADVMQRGMEVCAKVYTGEGSRGEVPLCAMGYLLGTIDAGTH